MAVIVRLAPITRGWAAYYRTAVSSEVFSALDHYVFRLTCKWAAYRHPDKPKRWIVSRYFGKFSQFRDDHWVFGDRDSGGYLVKFAWTSIVRHVMVKGGASPDDPALASYWANRRQRVNPPLDSYTLGLLTRQDGHCPLCGEQLLTADQPPQSPQQWERWWLQVTRKAIAASYLVHHGRPGPAGRVTTRLVHASCHRGLQARQRRSTAQSACPPSRLA
jgi:RNA-directed DNA polymerase